MERRFVSLSKFKLSKLTWGDRVRTLKIRIHLHRQTPCFLSQCFNMHNNSSKDRLLDFRGTRGKFRSSFCSNNSPMDSLLGFRDTRGRLRSSSRSNYNSPMDSPLLPPLLRRRNFRRLIKLKMILHSWFNGGKICRPNLHPSLLCFNQQVHRPGRQDTHQGSRRYNRCRYHSIGLDPNHSHHI